MEEAAAIIILQTSNGLSREMWPYLWVASIALMVEAFKHYEVWRPQPVAECSRDILCERIGRRHKADCPGSTIAIAVYTKGIRNA